MSGPGVTVGASSGLVWRRALGLLGLVALGALTLAACGGPSATTLTNSSVPATLKLKQNNSNAAQNLAKVFNQTYPGCPGSYAVFTLGGRAPTPVLTGKTIYPQLYSESATCSSSAKAETDFAAVKQRVQSFGATTVPGIGDGAIVATSTNDHAVSYSIFWRDGATLASVQLSGPDSNSHITEAEAKLLAHRQISLH